MSYLTRDELVAKHVLDAAAHDRARAAYGADGALASLDEKIRGSVDGDGGAKIPRWRLYRTFGPDWRRKPAAWVTLAVGTLAKKAWAGKEPGAARSFWAITPLCAGNASP